MWLLMYLQVKMRDVLALVNGILCANSLSLGLCQGVPPVLQQHVDTMSLEVQEQLGPVGAAARVPLQGQVSRSCGLRFFPPRYSMTFISQATVLVKG